MTMRFKIGEMAIVAVAHPKWLGKECEVVEYAEPSTGYQYRVQVEGANKPRLAWDWQLRKIDAPEEPESLHRDETIEEESPA